MKTAALILLCFVALLAISEMVSAQYSQDLCDSWGCSMDCFDQGLHGECDGNGGCTCSGCIYRACRKYCIQQNQIGQCDDRHCLCL